LYFLARKGRERQGKKTKKPSYHTLLISTTFVVVTVWVKQISTSVNATVGINREEMADKQISCAN
jgi:hypothetical protein